MRPFIILILFATSCSSPGLLTLQEVNTFNENITFKIHQVKESKSIATQGGAYRTKSGFKFVQISMTFTNNTNSKQDLKFNKIYLVDPIQRIKMEVDFNMKDTYLNFFGSLESSIEAGENKTRKLVFTFPEKSKPQFLLIDDRLIPIKYVQSTSIK